MTNANEQNYDPQRPTPIDAADPSKKNPSQEGGQQRQQDPSKKDPMHESGQRFPGQHDDPSKKDPSQADDSRQRDREHAEQGEKRRA